MIGLPTITYDNNGNLTNYGSSTTHTWNYRNQLIQTTKSGNTTSYGYDYAGNRTSLKNGGITTRYANKLYSTNGATTTKHIFAGDTLIATVERVGTATTTHIIHPDHLGGTNVVTDANGDRVQTTDYYPYGALRINSQTGSFDEHKKFTGYERDSSTGLNYAGARYQDPSRGQFLTMDPVFINLSNLEAQLTDPQQWNSYSYARDNPLRFIDPTGEILFELGGGVFGLGGGIRYDTNRGVQLFVTQPAEISIFDLAKSAIGVGISLKIDPDGTLDTRHKPGEQYVARERMIVPGIGKFKTYVGGKFNPAHPFSLGENIDIEEGWAVGLRFSYSHKFIYSGKIQDSFIDMLKDMYGFWSGSEANETNQKQADNSSKPNIYNSPSGYYEQSDIGPTYCAGFECRPVQDSN